MRLKVILQSYIEFLKGVALLLDVAKDQPALHTVHIAGERHRAVLTPATPLIHDAHQRYSRSSHTVASTSDRCHCCRSGMV